MAAPSRFDLDTALRPQGGRTYGAHIDRGWWIEHGPNGGFLAALVLRALVAEVADPERTPRSLTVQYLAAPGEGDATITVTVEKSGKLMAFASARMFQGDRLIAIALAAFGRSLPGPTFADLTPPVVPPPDACPRVADLAPADIPMRERYDLRWAIGEPPFTGASESVAGGWMRLAEPRALDAPLLAAYADAWVPPVFARLTAMNPVPTIDLTVHFRSPLPRNGMADDAFVLAVFRTRVAADGYIEEDGELWSDDGVLLAQSRQLAVLLPTPPHPTPAAAGA